MKNVSKSTVAYPRADQHNNLHAPCILQSLQNNKEDGIYRIKKLIRQITSEGIYANDKKFYYVGSVPEAMAIDAWRAVRNLEV